MSLLKSITNGVSKFAGKVVDAIPGLAPVIGAAAEIGQNFWSAHQLQKASASRNRQQMALQDYYFNAESNMAGSAHQREMQDLRAAGLNPILTATGGQGSPVVNASVPRLETTLGESSARSYARAGNTAEKLLTGMLASDIAIKKEEARSLRLANESTSIENDILRDQRDVSNDETLLNRILIHAKTSALEREDDWQNPASWRLVGSRKGKIRPFMYKDTKVFQDLQQHFINSAQKQRMVDSMEHQIFEDAGNVADKLLNAIKVNKLIKLGRGRR